MVTINALNQVTASSGKVLQGQGVGVASAFSTCTYPSTATGTGKILRADGTNFVATTATFPDLSGTSGNLLTSDGTNWSSSAPSASGILTATNTLTNAQIKALHGTPVQAVAAPGAGKIIAIIGCTGKLIYGGTNAFTAAAAQTIDFYYGTTVAGAPCLANAILTGTSTQIQARIGNAVAGAATTSYENVAINLYNLSATEITGNAANNNTILWILLYQIITL